MTDIKKRAYQFIIVFGIISLLGDIIYEGARSVNAQYLKGLGANALWVGIVAGLGEFVGYAIRLVSGYLSDKTRAYWLFTFIGYGLLITVPLLALTGIWQVAALLMIGERLGKALRSPAKDTILSQVTTQVGRGLGFGIHEAMDQIGAIAGPLMFTFIFAYVVDYNLGYKIMWIPFILL
ncbi:MAG TPA: MFS transporter, partial [Spirochaetota bacterium]|nr:MFS transporter [Spirochaetota bacterium]